MSSFTDRLNLYQRIIDIVRRKASGTPEVFASTLCMSVRKMQYLLEEMREEWGVDIQYCHHRRCYVLKNRIVTNFEIIKVLDEEEDLGEIRGGCKKLWGNLLDAESLRRWG